MKRYLILISLAFSAAFTVLFLVACTPETPPLPNPNLLDKHNGYWKGTARDVDGTPVAVIINDVHADNETGEVVVYAQSERVSDGILQGPPQLAPGECTNFEELGYVCGHPDAVYLNGSGEELTSGDGNDGGAWWVKHAWVLNDESSRLEACRMGAEEIYTACYTARGVLDEDGNTQKISIISLFPLEFYNLRYVELNADPIEYYVDAYGPANILLVRLTMTCQNIASPFDGFLQSCPTP